MKRVYFDYAASTPVDPRVLKAMQPYFSGKFGNPGSLHFFGQEAMAALDRARETLARALGADFRQIIFTSSATEANNFAIKGTFFKARKLGRFVRPKILVSAIEHESVHEAARALKDFGATVVYLPVDGKGTVNLIRLKKELDEQVILVSVMLGNNEVGTIEPVAEISRIIQKFRNKNNYPLIHCDAAQAFPYIKLDVNTLGVDLLTVSSQKIYGPKGAGALYVRDKNFLTSLISGVGQEYGIRAGTEDIPAIVGFGAATDIAEKLKTEEAQKLAAQREYFWQRTKKTIPNVDINGPLKGSLPHIVNIYFPGQSAEAMLARLDLAGFAVSAGSACTARATKPSHVLLAMGHKEKRARGSLRISFGRTTKKADIDKLVLEFKKLEYE